MRIRRIFSGSISCNWDLCREYINYSIEFRKIEYRSCVSVYLLDIFTEYKFLTFSIGINGNIYSVYNGTIKDNEFEYLPTFPGSTEKSMVFDFNDTEFEIPFIMKYITKYIIEMGYSFDCIKVNDKAVI